jgi:RND superfamily putative drug exporter
VWGLTAITDVSFIVQFLIALIGLGVAIDYSLLIVTRWREERAAGHDNTTAIQRAMETAGHAVVFSGSTVAIGLFALVALPVPFLRSVGYGGMLIPLVSVAVSLTLLPVLLATVGPRLDWPRRRRGNQTSRAWERWAALMVRRRTLAATIGLALLGVLIVAAFSLKVGTPSAASLATSGEAAAGYDALVRAGIAPGVLTPFEVLVEGGDPSAVAAVMADVDGIIGAVAPTGPEWQRDETLLVVALPAAEGSAAASSETLDRARDVAHDQAGRVLIGGSAAAEADFSDAVYGNAPVMIGLIVAVTYVLLVRAFRSLLLPLKAVVVNVLSVGAAYGVLVLVWQEGFGSELLWGIEATQAISTWLPLMVFSFLFGLSMDYEVFILARMREEYDATGSTDAAVIRGLSYTGRLVTAAALILFLAFVSLAAIPETEVKIMATGLAAGILIDATIVRALLVPAAVSLMGRWNWWLPTWLDRFVPRSAQKTERSATAVSSPAD